MDVINSLCTEKDDAVEELSKSSCILCQDKKVRIECSVVDDSGNAIIGCFAKYCPQCGRKL